MGNSVSKIIFFTVCLCMVIATTASAKTVSLAWDPSPSANIAGYKIYYKANSSSLPLNGSGATEGVSPIDVGTNLSTSVTGLSDTQIHYFSVTAYDTSGYESSYSNIVTSAAVGVITNHAPVLAAIGNKSVNEGTSLSFTLSASDPDGNSLTYTATGLPSGANFNPATQTFIWIPSNTQAGSYNLIFSVSDGSKSDTETVTISVSNVNRTPVLAAIGSKSVNEGTNLSFTLSASDPDGDSLAYTVSGLPSGANFNPATRTFTWIPSSTQAGSYNLSFRVSDGSLSDSETVTISVGNINRSPVLAAIGNKSVNIGASLSFILSASDPDGGSLTYSVSGLPGGANFNPSTQTFIWMPSNTQAGSYNLIFRVSDGSLSDSETVTISVGNVNRPPVLAAIGSKSVNTGASLSFTLSASDPDGDSLTYTATGLPSGASFTAATLTFEWTPGDTQTGNNIITFRVSDGSLSDTETVTISVGSTVLDGLSLLPSDSGLPGVARLDGGDDANNYVNGMPKSDLQYVFRILLRDTSGGEVQNVILHLNGYAYTMTYEAGDLKTGATYGFTTRLGPAATQWFHFETRDATENLLSRFPADSELNGPQVEFLNGKNIIGVPGDIKPLRMSSVEAIGTAQSFRWIPSEKQNGSYSHVDNSGPVIPGEGYVIKRATDTSLPSMEQFGENPAQMYEIPVKTGWNLIANPYAGNVPLSDVLVQSANSEPISWADAVNSLVMIDGMYYYPGKDWGNSNIFESSVGQQGAILIPRIGYWIYVNSINEPVSLIIPKPRQ